MCLFGSEYTCVVGEIKARTVNLAQASRTRLSESDEGSPTLVCAKGRPGDPLKFLSE